MPLTDPYYSTAISDATGRFVSAEHGLLIGGQWAGASGDERLPVVDPSTGETVGSIADAQPVDIARACAAARRAFDDGTWRNLSPHDKTKVLIDIAELIDTHAGELAELESIDVGKPISSSIFEIRAAADAFRYYAGWPTKILGDVNAVESSMFSYSVREPVGVVAGIIPWNGPLGMACSKVAPALACGNTIVLKPAEQASLTSLRLGALCVEAGVPPGVVNVATGGATTGAALVSDSNIDKIAFTGSTEVGRSIMRAASDRLTKVSLELGGKSPNVVFADADLEAAADAAFSPFGVWYNSGQVCLAGTRVIVERSAYDGFLEAIEQRSRGVTVGPALAAETQMGPLVSSEQLERVMGYLDVGQDEGASIAFGGNRIGNGGFFVEPTLFTGVRPGMRILEEEIFGPVVVAIPFDDEQQAVRMANDTEYGLGASIWTRDAGRAHRMANAIEAGLVWVNTYGVLDWAVSFGGYKQSGFGRELGRHSIELYTQLKSVTMKIGE